MNNVKGGRVLAYKKQFGGQFVPENSKKYVDEYMGKDHPWVFDSDSQG